ncbi:unnamed protein product [Rotaria magnacalcarata]
MVLLMMLLHILNIIYCLFHWVYYLQLKQKHSHDIDNLTLPICLFLSYMHVKCIDVIVSISIFPLFLYQRKT